MDSNAGFDGSGSRGSQRYFKLWGRPAGFN
jgi:hypothetical protein